jgi:hypothetical protein
MTEQELRALVRDAVARHVGTARSAAAGAGAPFAMVRQHASHALFTVPAGSDIDGPCLIEPTVMCNHCGYCRSMGH